MPGYSTYRQMALLFNVLQMEGAGMHSRRNQLLDYASASRRRVYDNNGTRVPRFRLLPSLASSGLTRRDSATSMPRAICVSFISMTRGSFELVCRTRTVSPGIRPGEHRRLIVSGSGDVKNRIEYDPCVTSESLETEVPAALSLAGIALPPGHVDGGPSWAERLSMVPS